VSLLSEFPVWEIYPEKKSILDIELLKQSLEESHKKKQRLRIPKGLKKNGEVEENQNTIT
jgi:hypothetical protein